MGAVSEMTIPQVIVTLSPSGALQAELPGSNGSRRVVPLLPGQEIGTLERILAAQQSGQLSVGEDGAPTGAQALHWQRHAIFRDPACPFCASELQTVLASDKKARARRESHEAGRGVRVTKLAPRVKGKQGRKAIAETMEELGL